ncbi:MAG: ABC transporter permease [Candidatus Altiarchaeota archaeon]
MTSYHRQAYNKKTYFISMIWALVVREFKGRYRRSLLGPLWALIQPLFYMVLFTFIRGIFTISSEGTPYIIFSYCALVPWTFFSTAVSRCGNSIYGYASLIKKIPLDREVYLLANIIISVIEFFISAIILVAMMIWFKTPVGAALLWLPLLIAVLLVITFAFGLGFAAVGTYKQDVLFGIPFLMQFWMLASPVAYPISQVPEGRRLLYSLNPMVGVIEGFRNVLVKNMAPDLTLLAISIVVTIAVLAVCWPMFRYLSQYFADVI